MGNNVLDAFRNNADITSRAGDRDPVWSVAQQTANYNAGVIDVPDAPEGAPTYRDDDAMVSFRYVLEHGTAPFTGAEDFDLTVDLDVDDAYNNAVNEIRETVSNRITNPDPDDAQGQEMNALLNKQPWDMEDRENWERGLSEMTSEEMANHPGLDNYRSSAPALNPDGSVSSNEGNVNDLSVDVENGTSTLEFDCDTMSFTEGMILQSIEDDLLPPQSEVESGDLRYAGEYHLMPNNVSFGPNQDVGYHAAIASSVTGNIIEGTAQPPNSPYHVSSDPDWTFEDLAAGESFVSERGPIYSFDYMDDAEATRIRLENGDYDEVYDRMNQGWDEIPDDYLPADYEMSDNMTYMVNLEAKIDRVENAFDDPRYGPEHYPAIQARLDELYAERDEHIVTMSVNGTFAEFTQEMTILERGESAFDAYKASIRSRLDTRWAENLDEYGNEDVVDTEPEPEPEPDIGRWAGIIDISSSNTDFPDDYEMSRDMRAMLEQQAIIEDENSTPRQREIAEMRIENHLEAMIEDGSIVDFEQEVDILASAQNRFEPPVTRIPYDGSPYDIEGGTEFAELVVAGELEVAEVSIQHAEFLQNQFEVVGLDPTQIGTFDSVRLSQMIDQLDMNSINVTDVSPALQNIIYQINEIDNYEEALLADPDNEGLSVGQGAAQESYIDNISYLAEEGELPDIQEEINTLNLAQAEQRLRAGETGFELVQGNGVTVSVPENAI